MHILITDDDPISRIAVRTSVERLGHVCTVAADGEDAWRLFEEQHPDVVISDWRMPRIDGTQLTRRIREARKDVYTYVIILTSEAAEQDARDAMLAGADDLVVKPLSTAALERHLIAAERVIELHRSRHVDARLDPLTGIGNRQSAMEDLDVVLGRARRYLHPVAVVMLDIDRFKQYNDAVGHLAGDEVLKAVASTLAAGLRGSDALYRYGGEEFLALLPEQNTQSAAIVGRRLLAALETLAIPNPAGGTITASAGVADLSPDETAAELITRADRALDAAKAAGRNRVEVVEHERPSVSH
jgi:diguanylate cyclase (GGDEF)-like protein